MPSWTPPLPSRVVAARRLPLVGRRAELETFERVWAEVEQARRQVVFLGGEPGAGKTRLVAEVAGVLHDNDVAVLIGTSTVDAGVPYQPFAEMLDVLFSNAAIGSLDAVLSSSKSELHRLSPHVLRHCPELTDASPPAGEIRKDLFDAVALLFGQLAGDRPLVLILDDLHWAQLPTLALLEHVVQALPAGNLRVLGTFRTTAPDRSDELAARVAELHRLDGVQRIDLPALDTDAIAEYVTLRSGLPANAARAPAAVLRDRTGGNPFFLRELWADLERRGGLSALRSQLRVPASIGDTLAARLAGLSGHARQVVDLAAILGDTFDLATLVAASEVDRAATLAGLDEASALGLIEPGEHRDRYSFVHALARQAVLDRMPPSRVTVLHARAAEALEQQPSHASLVPQLARHYLAAHILGFHEQAIRSSRYAGELAERSLAFEDAAVWFERAAELPECEPDQRADLLLAAGSNYVRACHFPHARSIYDRLATSADPRTRLTAAMGFEDASWRPGLIGPRAADVLTAAIADSVLEDDDPRYVRALASLGRALALAGETDRARRVGARAIELARRIDDEETLLHAVTTSLWHGMTPDVAELQLQRTNEVFVIAKRRRDHETVGAAVNFRATVSYLCGRPDELQEALLDALRVSDATGQQYYRHVHSCLAQADAFTRGDFATAERWADETLKYDDAFGDEMTEGPHGVQMFMIRRETGGLDKFRPYLDGRETFTGRWVPGLLALYTELGVTEGTNRALRHLLDRELTAHDDEAQWPMELAFMVEGALALRDGHALRRLRPLVGEYAGKNLVAGTLIAVFGSADRLLARIDAAIGDDDAAAHHFDRALEMDRRMRSAVHVAETLAYQAVWAGARGRATLASTCAREARGIAELVGQQRVLRILQALEPSAGPDGLSDRELDVLRLLAAGLSNQEIGERLHISANTAANHVRSILMKTRAANRTQAAVYAAQRNLV
jgi:DNA-binding CsgD family transcriptional regulator